jgi:hypothetical protein
MGAAMEPEPQPVNWHFVLSEEWIELGCAILDELDIDESDYSNKIIKERLLDAMSAPNILALINKAGSIGGVDEGVVLERLGLDRGTPHRWFKNEVQPHPRMFFGLLVRGLYKELQEAVPYLPDNGQIRWESISRTMGIIQDRELGQGFDLRLMPAVKEVGDILPDGKGKKLIVVANVNSVIHMAMFDYDGKLVKSTNENELKNRARKIASLRKQLESLWSQYELPRIDKNRVITAVTSLVDYNRRQPSKEEFVCVGLFMCHPNAGRMASSDPSDLDPSLVKGVLVDVVRQTLRSFPDGKLKAARRERKANETAYNIIREWSESYTLLSIGWPVDWLVEREDFDEDAVGAVP